MFTFPLFTNPFIARIIIMNQRMCRICRSRSTLWHAYRPRNPPTRAVQSTMEGLRILWTDTTGLNTSTSTSPHVLPNIHCPSGDTPVSLCGRPRCQTWPVAEDTFLLTLFCFTKIRTKWRGHLLCSINQNVWQLECAALGEVWKRGKDRNGAG